ncbi:AAA family ATPase [Aphanizomenon sp. CS-733/32]|uniref:AAA family ATPase n=1 Tax=Aphanizomenon sp. CS-733/32 TaxID=3021715 RepID=UPI002FEE64FB
MLSSLTLKNFKPFENQSFSLKPLTLLTGLNSTGKSSVLQSLLLLRQSCLQDDLLDRVGLVLNGDLVSIGTGQDALFKRAKEDLITKKTLKLNFKMVQIPKKLE